MGLRDARVPSSAFDTSSGGGVANGLDDRIRIRA